MKVVRPDVDGGPVADAAPSASEITNYDRRHLVTYVRLLDAVRNGADEETIVRDVLKSAPGTSPERNGRFGVGHAENRPFVLHDAQPARPHNRRDAMRAPSAAAASFPQTISSATYSRPAKVPKPQSVPAITRPRSPTTGTACSSRPATSSGCSTKFVVV